MAIITQIKIDETLYNIVDTNAVNLTTDQTINGIKTFNAPTNTSGTEQATVKFKTANGGQIVFGKEGNDSGSMIRLDQTDGTCRLRFRSSATAGAMVWEQPEKGSVVYMDVETVNFRNTNSVIFNNIKNASYLGTDGSGKVVSRTISTATSSTTGLVKSATTGTTANRDYNVQVNTDGTMKVNVPWTDNNTWRGIQNNLTSDSTTDSLSAAQGKVLKGLVDGKAASSHNHSYNDLTNKPTIGSGTLTIQKNGSNVATFGANSTSNVTANITVPTALSNLSGTLSTDKLTEPTIINGVTSTSQGIIDITSADRLAFLPAGQIIIEKSTDGGTTWVSAGYSDDVKRQLFSSLENGGISIPLNSSGVKSCKCMLRVTITGMKYNVPAGTAETDKYKYWNSTYVTSAERYFNPNLCTLWLSSNSDKIQTTIQRATGANPNNWVTDTTANLCSGWSGRSTIKLGGANFGGGTNQTSNYWNYRLIFRTQANDGSFDDSKLSSGYTTSSQSINGIRFYSSNLWNCANNMMRNGHLYVWDLNQNVTFPASLRATSFNENGTLLSAKYQSKASVSGTSLVL